MDTSRARQLRDARNRALHIVCHCLHQIGQFVDDNDDVGNFVRDLDIVFGSRVADA
jgi:hypothetical protein